MSTDVAVLPETQLIVSPEEEAEIKEIEAQADEAQRLALDGANHSIKHFEDFARHLRELRDRQANRVYGWGWEEYLQHRFQIDRDRYSKLTNGLAKVINIRDYLETNHIDAPVPEIESPLRGIPSQWSADMQGATYVVAVTIASATGRETPTRTQIDMAREQVASAHPEVQLTRPPAHEPRKVDKETGEIKTDPHVKAVLASAAQDKAVRALKATLNGLDLDHLTAVAEYLNALVVRRLEQKGVGDESPND